MNWKSCRFRTNLTSATATSLVFVERHKFFVRYLPLLQQHKTTQLLESHQKDSLMKPRNGCGRRASCFACCCLTRKLILFASTEHLTFGKKQKTSGSMFRGVLRTTLYCRERNWNFWAAGFIAFRRCSLNNETTATLSLPLHFQMEANCFAERKNSMNFQIEIVEILWGSLPHRILLP